MILLELVPLHLQIQYGPIMCTDLLLGVVGGEEDAHALWWMLLL